MANAAPPPLDVHMTSLFNCMCDFLASGCCQLFLRTPLKISKSLGRFQSESSRKTAPWWLVAELPRTVRKRWLRPFKDSSLSYHILLIFDGRVGVCGEDSWLCSDWPAGPVWAGSLHGIISAGSNMD